ncbi:hypothetical protein ACJ72_02613 [Emergomyces africanus]|uniref:Uncharacterized protein n=1 Tax=Emergomyces africanus TaxID=1955775 RepID=A0A1B7P1Z2_9EURO|nr:hypothetical protein ACJ72_02613 [Emergomyces africanus]
MAPGAQAPGAPGGALCKQQRILRFPILLDGSQRPTPHGGGGRGRGSSTDAGAGSGRRRGRGLISIYLKGKLSVHSGNVNTDLVCPRVVVVVWETYQM